jgi:hypothetical protein
VRTAYFSFLLPRSWPWNYKITEKLFVPINFQGLEQMFRKKIPNLVSFNSFSFVQLSPAAVPDLVPEPVVAQPAARAVGRFQVRPSTSTPAIIPRELSFHDELLEKCRERGLTPDRPALFGVRPVTNPSVSKKNFFLLLIA